jgi:hypothetical protein
MRLKLRRGRPTEIERRDVVVAYTHLDGGERQSVGAARARSNLRRSVTLSPELLHGWRIPFERAGNACDFS